MTTSNKKVYDENYFTHWYHHPKLAVIRDNHLRRRVRMAVSISEYLLDKKLQSVLDVGCGEGPWRAELRKMRPGLRYVGVDSSEYAITRYGRKRNLRFGTLGTLNRLKIRGSFDLIVCSDVLHYVGDTELKQGVRAMSRLLDGVAFLECFTEKDETIGDQEGIYARPASTYRRIFKAAGLVSLGMHFYAGKALAPSLMSLERSG